MFETTIAGSLPKPSWLAEQNKLWPQWKLSGDELAAAKAGFVPGVRTPIMLDGEPMASPNPAPRLGQHTAEILKEIGEG